MGRTDRHTCHPRKSTTGRSNAVGVRSLQEQDVDPTRTRQALVDRLVLLLPPGSPRAQHQNRLPYGNAAADPSVRVRRRSNGILANNQNGLHVICCHA